jgi:5-formyltetrahydrofolate cyclo-ligase
MKIERTPSLPQRRPKRRRRANSKPGADTSLRGPQHNRAEAIAATTDHEPDTPEAIEHALERDAALELAVFVGQSLQQLSCPIGQHNDPRTLRIM